MLLGYIKIDSYMDVEIINCIFSLRSFFVTPPTVMVFVDESNVTIHNVTVYGSTDEVKIITIGHGGFLITQSTDAMVAIKDSYFYGTDLSIENHGKMSINNCEFIGLIDYFSEEFAYNAMINNFDGGDLIVSDCVFENMVNTAGILNLGI